MDLSGLKFLLANDGVTSKKAHWEWGRLMGALKRFAWHPLACDLFHNEQQSRKAKQGTATLFFMYLTVNYRLTGSLISPCLCSASLPYLSIKKFIDR